MKKFVLILIVFLCLSIVSVGQQNDSARVNPYSHLQKEKSDFANRLYFGGSFMLSLGSYTSIGIWPLVGYKVTSKLSVGLQPGYEYLKYDSYYYGGSYETSNYGARVFARYRIIPQIYVHTEYAAINYEIESKLPSGQIDETREWVPFLFLGGGLSQEIGRNSYVYIQVLFDVLNDENSPYRNGAPFWSMGIVAGF
ncbi:MAG: hypothetical protein EOM83_01145 [Clostridia bacterium]|nr:hypothetical protein [Clostridia bacterium]